MILSFFLTLEVPIKFKIFQKADLKAVEAKVTVICPIMLSKKFILGITLRNKIVIKMKNTENTEAKRKYQDTIRSQAALSDSKINTFICFKAGTRSCKLSTIFE